MGRGTPGAIPGRFQRVLSSAAPFFAPPALIPAFGVSGAGTFVLSLDPGAKLSYAWVTEIISHYDGTEQRISWQALPAVRVEGSAFLLDTADQLARATLMRAVASGATFLVALPMEEVTATGPIVDGVVPVANTATLDWALPGQRVIVLGRDGSAGAAVVQSVFAASINLDALPTGVPASGARIMPLVPVVLDMQQGFTRHPVNVQMWDIRARASTFGWCSQDSMGLGVDVLTADAGLIAASSLTDDNLIIWDRINSVDGTAAETMASRAEVVDLGGVPFAIGGNLVAEWLRPIKLRSSRRIDFQWLKAVTRHLRGAQGAFILPTHRSDLGFVSSPTFGQLLVTGDYASWFPSVAHRNLAITAASGPVQYIGVLSVVDNNDGTNTLTLTDNPFGPITRISFAELVRLETDQVEPTWDGMTMTCDLVAHVVQDTIATNETVTSLWAGHGLDGDFTFPADVFDMTRDMYWETGQLPSGSTINTNGFVPHFRTALIGPDVGTAVIQCNGFDGGFFLGGLGYLFGTSSLGGGSGDGANGAHGAGAQAPAQPFGLWPARDQPGLGGAGGNGTNIGGAGGGGGPPVIEPDVAGSIDVLAAVRMRLMTDSSTPIAGGAGGAAGGGSGTASGGGGGAGAGNVVVCAGRFINESNILVQAIGGAGGAGVGVNCGGGGGGGGGMIALIAGSLPFPPAANINNHGGPGGAGGGGAGGAGSSGSAGAPPFLFVG